MEGGEDANEEPAYLTDSPSADVLHIQVDMVDDERGGIWCLHGNGGQDDVATVATRLRHLDDIGNREDFHRQCCEVSCCTAKQVIQIMHSGSYKVSLVQIASEIFLLQNLLNPTHYNCTEELLDSWLSVQEEKDHGTSAILENVNKMVALVESVEHLVIFLRSLLKRFGTRFLGLCSDLALRALKQQRHLAVGEGGNNEIIADGASRERLSQTLDLVGQMYFETHRQIYLSCLLSAFYVDPTDQRYSALDVAFTGMPDATAAAAGGGGAGHADSIPVSDDVLETVNLFRPVELDLDVGWTKLQPSVSDLLFNAGYRYEPMNNALSGCPATGQQVSLSSAFNSGVVGDSLWMRTTQLDGNEATRQTTADRGWCGVVNPFDCNTSSAFVDGKKPWSAGDASSAALGMGVWSTEYCRVNAASSVERDVIQVNGKRVDVNATTPDSTSTDVAVSSTNNDGFRLEYVVAGSNGRIESNGFGSGEGGLDPWKGSVGVGGGWPVLESDDDDDASNPLNIASAEEEDVNSLTDEGVTTFDTPSSAFSKKRSASAEMMSSSSQLVTEPCRKRRAVSTSRTKTVEGKRSEEKAPGEAECHLTQDVRACRRSLRPKDRLDRSRVVTRKTFCFRYKYSSSFSAQLCSEETGKRSVSESDSSTSTVSLPNGIKLRNCFIRLNRVRTEDGEPGQRREGAASELEAHGSTSVTLKDVHSASSTPLTLKEQEIRRRCPSPTLAEAQSSGPPTVEEGPGYDPLLLKEEMVKAEEGTWEQEMAFKEEEAPVAAAAAAAAAEDKVVQCVCDGCGEIVPDCSWLTAHIVTCSGRPESGVTEDALMDDDGLTNPFQSDPPIWEGMGGGGGCGEMSDAGLNGMATEEEEERNGRMMSMEGGGGGEMHVVSAPYSSSHSPPDVDAASNLMQQLMQGTDAGGQSSFIYDPSMTSETAGVKVIQMADGTAFSVSRQPSDGVGGGEVLAGDDQCGKEVLYNGVYMYEFTEYQCDLCLLTFASQAATLDHIRSSDHSGSSVSRNSFCCCLKCSIRYREKHIMWHHVLYLCANGAADDRSIDDSRLYRCLVCCKAFLSAAFLRRHVSLQHPRHGGGGLTAAPSGHRALGQASNGLPQSGGPAPPALGLSDAGPTQVVSRLTDYGGVGLDGQLVGAWNCFQVSDGGAGLTAGGTSMAQDGTSFSVATQDTTTEANLKAAKTAAAERNGVTGAGTSNSTLGACGGGGGGGAEAGADSQALLDLACSIVLGGCSPSAPQAAAVATEGGGGGSSAPPAASHATPPAVSSSSSSVSSSSAAAAAAGGGGAGQSTASTTGASSSSSSRRTAKGIMYKNVFMQCIVNYLCSTCKKDLSTKASKKEHKSSPCFDADSKRFTYLRQYSYLCPYCSEKFPSQKFCRQHQLSVCLQLMGVKTDELNHKQLLCPFCDRKYFNIITLKGHMTLIHKVNKLESSQILGTSGLLEELISFAPDAAGLSEKAKKAKAQTTAEEDRKHAEANRIHPPNPPPALVSPREPVERADVLPFGGVTPAELKSDGDPKVERGVEDGESKASKPSLCASDVVGSSHQPSNDSDVENATSHDSGLESNVAELTLVMESEGCTKDVERCELQIVEAADPEGLTFDGDEASNDNTSTDDPSSELEELSCETTDNTPLTPLPTTTTNHLKESQIDTAGETLDGAKKSLKRKKSNKKTRRKVVAKTRKKLH